MQRSKWLVHTLLFAYIGVSFTYQVVSSASFVSAYFGLRKQVEEPFQVDPETDTVMMVTPAAKRAGLRLGDRPESIDGIPYRGRAQWQWIEWHAQPGDIVRLQITRANGAPVAISIPLQSRSIEIHTGEAILLVVLRVVVPLLCLMVGYWVTLARPLDPNAWFILLLLSYPEVFASAYTSEWWPGIWLVLRLAWHMAVEMFAAVALLWLGLLFPERSRMDIRLPWLKWSVLGTVVIGFGIGLATDYSGWYNDHLLTRRAQIDSRVSSILKWTFALCIILYWTSIFDSLRTASSADARRRLRVLCLASVIGLGGMFVIFGALPWFGIADPATIYWLDLVAMALMAVYPLGLAYVVIVQRAMDVRILLRMGTKYALARTTLGIMELAAAVLLLIFFVVPAFTTHSRDAIDIGLSSLAIGILIWLFGTRENVSRRVQNWLDRRFFREAYDAELVLSELASRVRTITDSSALIHTVTHTISEVLHVPQIAAFLRNGEVFQLQHAVGISMDHSLPISMPLKSSAPVAVYGQEVLDTMRAEVILPLPGRSKPMGLMLLGPKLSEEPYSTSDLRLLESVGVQTGLGLEVSELAHELAQEAAQYERMRREVEIAREVQERLFPQSIPAVRGVDLAGHCRPAARVGGDYWDLFSLGDGRLALAIGDVSGKGISAALLMASLRASLRSIAEDHSNDLARLMTKLNRQVYQASAANRYATFFFAVFEEDSHLLRYINAGHNAPVILRGDGEVLRAETGGLVVGLLPQAEYMEGSIALHHGDLFLAYTDGMSEAMNADDEEWGEKRMIEAAAAARELCAKKILERVMQAADEFVQGAPQHDDMTLLVMKVIR
ncbi:MAG TPA: SpoIIE family protein phosphatase [Bryobacteraceae bacterium]|nr:SpoIIE family protein phosphatase [Bryobacteraceae bacterium]